MLFGGHVRFHLRLRLRRRSSNAPSLQILLGVWAPLITSGVVPVAINTLGWKCRILVASAGTLVTRTLYILIVETTNVFLMAKALAAEALYGLIDLLFEISYSYKKFKIQVNPNNQFTFFSTVVPAIIYMFLSCRPFVAITLSTGLVGVEVTSVSWLGQLTVGV